MNLLLIEPDAVSASGETTICGAQAAHLEKVLNVGPGQEVRIGVIDGPSGVGVVRSIEGGVVRLGCTFDAGLPPRPRVDLLLAVPRPKVMRRLWAQIAALGVGRIVLTNAARVERPYFDTHVLTPACYRPLLIEGLQQARDTRLPGVSIHRQFRVLVEDELDGLVGTGLRFVADPGAGTLVTAAVGQGSGRVLIAIGPEGGWNDFERGLLEAHGCRPVGMGARTLRTDTATIALLALVHASLGHG